MKNIIKRLAFFAAISSLFSVCMLSSNVYASNAVGNLSSSAYTGNVNPFTASGYKGQCTWYVWGRTYEKLGIKLNNQFYGNAATWWSRNKTYASGSQARGNSIGVFKGGSKGCGHVVFIESVSGDTINFTEANWGKDTNGVLKSLSLSQFKSRMGSGNFLGFIYVGKDNSGSTPTPNPDQSKVSGANAVIVNDWAYVRDENGNAISGKRVDINDNIKVDEINYDKQLAHVIYPTANGTSSGWITNCGIIKYYYQGEYHNGSTSETVYDASGVKTGALDPHESATPLFRDSKTNMLYIVYNTSKGTNTKAGYVKYNGGFNRF